MPVILDSHTQRFVQALSARGGPPLHLLPIEEARRLFTEMQTRPGDRLPAEVETRVIRGGPTHEIYLRIFRPRHVFRKQPVILFFHGGGWILGSAVTHDRLVRDLVSAAQAAVVVVDYALSPESRYPVALEQAYVAAQYIAEYGEGLNLDPRQIALAGDGAGGNLAAALALLAKERRGPRVRYQALFYPMLDASMEAASHGEFADGPWLTRAAVERAWTAYAPEASERNASLISPLHASLEQLTGLPPALVITSEGDVLRDEGEAYARRLMAAGVPVTALRFLGTIHDFMTLDGLASSPAARGAVAQAGAALQAALGGAPPMSRG